MADVIHQATEGAAVGPHRVVRWSPKDHAKFNRASRDIVRTLLLISRRISSNGRAGGTISIASQVDGAGNPSVVGKGLAAGSTAMHLPALPDEVWQLVISLQCVVLGARPVEILAGTGTSGFEDGPSTEARLGLLSGVAVYPPHFGGGVVVADWTNNRIRHIAADGRVVTIAGSGEGGCRDALGDAAQFNNPTAVAVTSRGEMLVADTDNHAIRHITPDGVVTTLAGSARGGAGWFRDGPPHEARFDHPSGVTVARDGSVVVADTDNHRVRHIALGGMVTTIAGTGTQGYRDGPAATAQFRYPQGVAVDIAGNVIVSERFDHRIRQISPDGHVRTLAGSSEEGLRDGVGEAARFNRPWGITPDPNGGVLVADTYNHCIRRISPDGTVTTAFAGLHPPFHFPRGISIDASGSFVVGERHRIQRVGNPEYHFS